MVLKAGAGSRVLLRWLAARRIVLMPVAMLGLAALTLYALHVLMAHVHLKDVRAAFHAIPPGRIAMALLLSVLSYGTLTLYDVIALRIIRRPLPYRIAALASFCSYTLSHNLGLSLLTGGSVRYRIYRAAGLGAADVARIIASASAAFWSGVFMLAAMMLLIHPSISLPLGLSPDVAKAAAIAVVLALAGMLFLMRRCVKELRLLGWAVPIPKSGQALAQMGIACIDLAAASGALFVLVPHASPALFPSFFLAYALAIIAGLVSHVPGGLGIFEAVMVATLPGLDRPALLAALIAYRALYYLLPLLLAVAAIALHEGRTWRKPMSQALSGIQLLASGMAPVMLSALVSFGGLILLISGSLPAVHWRLKALAHVVPMPFLDASHFAASIIGAVLILLAAGLYRRLDGAFWMTRLLLLAGALFSFLKGLDYEEAAALLVIAGLLQWTRPAFYRRTAFTVELLTPGWLVTVAVAVGLSIWIGFFAYKHVAYQNELWWHIGRRGDAARFLRASVAASVVVIGAALWRLLRPAVPRQSLPASCEGPSEAAMVMAERAEAFLAYTGDKLFITSASGRAFLMYQIQGHSWIVMGDPVGDRAEWPALLWQLRERADAAQGRILLYQISLDSLPIAVDLGLTLIKYGEEARVDLSRFSLEGSAARSLRHAVRRSEREGAQFSIVRKEDLPPLLDELEALSGRWLAAKGQGEKAFSVGRFDRHYLSRFDCALIRHQDRIVAFANIWPTQTLSELSVDLMRHEADMPYGSMDLLFVRLMQWGQLRRYRWFGLGLAPLSGLAARRLAPVWVKAAALLYRHGEAFYGFEGLRAYKEKFSPCWEPRFIAGLPGIGMARALVDLQRLVSGSGSSAAAHARVRPPLRLVV